MLRQLLVLALCALAARGITVDLEKELWPDGQSVTVHCRSTAENATGVWINPDGTDIARLNSSRVYYDEHARLHFAPVQLNDTGNYTCTDGWLSDSVVITVYIMPDYFFAGMVILAINGGLVVIFLICLTHSQLKQRAYLNQIKRDATVREVPVGLKPGEPACIEVVVTAEEPSIQADSKVSARPDLVQPQPGGQPDAQADALPDKQANAQAGHDTAINSHKPGEQADNAQADTHTHS